MSHTPQATTGSPDAAAEPVVDDTAPTLTPLTEPAAGVPALTDSPERLAEAVAALEAGAGPIAVDAERASGFRYGQRAYLVQLRRAGSPTVLIDPMAVPELSSLAAVINDQEWILHAADQDLGCLRELGLDPAAIFDTELASRLLGRAKVGLAAVVAENMGFELAKEHSAADWSTRPLPDSWLRYAALDVELLVELREILMRDLDAAGKLEWARQEFDHVRNAPPPAPRAEPWRRVSGLQQVKDLRGLAVARELFAAREELAQEIDRAPGRVLSAYAIVAAARSKPKSVGELGRVKEFSGKRVRRTYWYEAIARALALPDAELPSRRAPRQPGTLPPPRSWQERNPLAAARLEIVKTAVRARAEEITLPQENLLSPALQRRLAWELPENAPAEVIQSALREFGARPWQIEQLAGRLAAAMS